jgi:hypothetical protein
MIPRTIKRNLARLRRRERLIRLAWGVSRWLALVLGLLLFCALTDYAIDRDRDTPWSVRYALFGLQAAAAAVSAFIFVLWPQVRRLRDAELALWVEEKAHLFQHRLITAVELNQAGAKTGGMSDELILVVTREAERISQVIPFPRVADHRRLVWSVAVLVPVVLVAAIPLLIWPAVSLALLERQALHDVEVPRLVHLDNVTPEVLPVGERFQIVYRVTGPVDEETAGEVVVTPEGQPRDRYPLTFFKWAKDGEALFGVDITPSAADLSFTARLGDGRTRKPGGVHFVARPVVHKQEAWVRLPAYCGTTPDGQRYELPQGHGDVVGIPGSAVRLLVQTSKPIRGATLELLGPEGEARPADDEPGPEKVRRSVALRIAPSGQDAEAVFDLRPGETAYRIVVSDEYGFFNVPAPRRGLQLVPEEAPQISLLKDYFGLPGAETEVEGIPVPLGKAIRIPYVCHGPYGLGTARILYRVLPRHESGNEPSEPGPWTVLPLPEVTSTPKLGAFDPKRGIFENSSFDDEVPFHAVPSPNPDKVLGRQLGGGRYFLKTAGLVDAKGKKIELRKGDQVEYCVEVFADRDPQVGRPSARSETRVTTMVSDEEFLEWVNALQREEEQLRKLDKQQRGVFGN